MKTPTIEQMLDEAARVLTEITPEDPVTADSLREDMISSHVRNDGSRIVTLNCTRYRAWIDTEGKLHFEDIDQ